jgi:hypothetical protein
MTDPNPYSPRPEAPWFRWAGYASLLWFVLGVASYIYHVTLDPATLPADQQAMMAAVPDWMTSFFALAVWTGLAGGVLLVMRRKAAEPLLFTSLVGAVMQFSAYFVDPELRELVPIDGLAVPVIILALTWTVFWFARHSRQRGWLK